MKIVIDQCSGVSPRTPPHRLSVAGAQIARNVDVRRGSLRPLNSAGSVAVRFPEGTKTIYMWGETLSQREWFAWPSDVDVCRGQIAGDDLEWTVFTGAGYPKLTNANRHGLGGEGSPDPDETEPSDSSTIDEVYQSHVREEGEDASASSLGLVLTPLEDAFVLASGEVTISGGSITTTEGSDFTTFNEALNGVYSSLDSFERAAKAAAPSGYVVSSSLTYLGRVLTIERSEHPVVGEEITLSTPFVLTWGGTSAPSWIGAPSAVRLGLPTPEIPLWVSVRGVGALMPIGKEVWSRFDPALPPAYSLDEGGTWTSISISTNTDIATLHAELVAGLPSHLVGTARLGNTLFLYLIDQDPSKYLWFKWGETDEDIFKRTYETSYAESRTYTWTWIREVDGLVMESAPAEPSQMVGVCPLSDVVRLTFPGVGSQPTVPAGDGYDVTGVRIYRSAGGTFLFVAELGLDEFSQWGAGDGDDGSPFTSDALPSELLGEQIPMTMEPPEGLRGIVNLPNGIIAGFQDRDVYFCDPYRPYSWPEAYRLTVHFPIVGLGTLDTTLVVLTEGYPYFIQGAHPDSMVMVRGPVEQSCVSKSSIVTLDSSVLYASPDGLVAVSPGNFSNLTASLFTKEQWQEWFDIRELRGYVHDGRYYGFHPRKWHEVSYQESSEGSNVSLSGFVLDPSEGVLVTHDLPYWVGYPELRFDQLYVLDGASLRVWGEGYPVEFVWRSKRFDLPYEGWFSWAHVEAYGFPVLLRLLVDGVERFAHTVQDRRPFRLPSIVGRDWEIELSGRHEVTKVVLAQSSQELHES